MDGKRKVPFQASGFPASVTNEKHWCSYSHALATLKNGGGYSGLGYVLGDGICGVDLDSAIGEDGCIKPWAAEYVDKVDTAWEISQSGKGIHLFYTGDVPTAYKRKIEDGGVEVYADGRFFAVTGIQEDTPLAEVPAEFLIPPDGPAEAPEQVGDVPDPTEEQVQRCRERVMAGKDSIEGQFGSNAIFAACSECARWNLSPEQTLDIMTEYNDNKCFPPWSSAELSRKIREGRKKVVNEGEVGRRLTDDGFSDFDELPMDGEPTAPVVESNEVPRIIPFTKLRQFAGSIEWLIEDVLVANQFAGIVGQFKTLKTGLSLDMAVSLATGSPFLGRFNVPERKRIIIYTAEIGLPVAVAKLDAICAEKKLPGFDTIDTAFISASVPRIKSPKQLDQLKKDIEKYKADVVVIDPLGLAASGADARMLIEMGELLERAMRACSERNCTLIVNHHANRTATAYEPITLNNISGAGVAEFLRQWILLSHAQDYSDNTANLWMNVGGSAGHNGMYQVEINEGMVDGVLLENRTWKVKVRDETELTDGDCATIVNVVGTGESDVASIAKLTGIEKKKIYSILRQLVELGVMKYTDGGKVRVCQ